MVRRGLSCVTKFVAYIKLRRLAYIGDIGTVKCGGDHIVREYVILS